MTPLQELWLGLLTWTLFWITVILFTFTTYNKK